VCIVVKKRVAPPDTQIGYEVRQSAELLEVRLGSRAESVLGQSLLDLEDAGLGLGHPVHLAGVEVVGDHLLLLLRLRAVGLDLSGDAVHECV
jgi:hypothetical protein